MEDSTPVEHQELSIKPIADDGTSMKPIGTCHSVSEGSFVSKFWRAHTDKEWTEKDSSDDKIEDDVCGVALEENLRLVLSPDSSHRGRGFRNHRNSRKNTAAATATRFHEDLKSEDLDGMVVMFRAKADQFMSVILSPWPGLDKAPVVVPGTAADKETNEETSDAMLEAAAAVAALEAPSPAASKRYEIVFGGNNNTTTTIRKVTVRSSDSKENKTKKGRNEISSSVTIPSRVCRGFGGESETTTLDDSDENDACWMSYWVCLSNNRLYVGIGKVPGKECFGVLEEKDDAGVQQEAKEPQGEGSVKDEPDTLGDQGTGVTEVLPIRYVGIGNGAAGQKFRDSVIQVNDLVVTNVPPCLDGLLKEIPSQDDLPIVCLAPASSSSSGMDVDEDTETLELKKYMEDYKAECLTRKKRAKKYGTNYREQPMKEFLPWTMAKRLKGNHSVGSSAVAKPHKAGFVAGDIDFLDPDEVSKREARLARFAAKTNPNNDDGTNIKNEDGNDTAIGADGTAQSVSTIDGLPLEKAWDKESMLRPIRRDPPPYLWNESPSHADTLKTTRAPDPFAMYDETTKAATWITDKLHFSAIDWAAFKQIRNDDLVQHLESYGPIKYIEWLGDVSCNVCFANKAAASRALVCLSNELPSPPPPPASAPIAEVNEGGNPEPPTTEPASGADVTPRIDLGCMTWRFAKRPIRKVSNDRFGKKGTTARYLLRLATTEDVLIDRPNSWPEPPGGFHADRVLGPKSDYAAAKKRKTKPKKKKNQQQEQQQQQQQQQKRRGSNSKRKRGRGDPNGKTERKNSSKINKIIENPMDLLNRGLSSSRGGFSVEDMEKKRQERKRQKTS